MTTGMQRTLSIGYDAAGARLPEALATEGFGVLTQIDVRDTLQAKLGVEFRRYKIFGACNPALAHRALQAELAIGVMLPCNVVVYEGDDGKAMVLAIDPTQTLATAGNPKLEELAKAVKEKLTRAIGKLE